MDTTIENQVMIFFKALSDVERLKITGLIALEAHTAQEIAEKINLKLSRVVNHLELLKYSGLITQQNTRYCLDDKAVEALARQVLAGSRPTVKLDELDGPEYDKKVLSAYLLPDGKIKSLPAQQKKLNVILRYILPVFEPGVVYPEKSVNELLRRYYEDTASLRRYLVDEGMLTRQNGQYQKG